MKLRYTSLHGARLARPRAGDAGYDLRAVAGYILTPGQQREIHTGLCLEITRPWWLRMLRALRVPVDLTARIEDRSSRAAGRLYIHGRIIDWGYRGEVIVLLENSSLRPVTIAAGERIAQLVIGLAFCPPVEEAASLRPTERGAAGFGSTGEA